jgi:hypothetical protein
MKVETDITSKAVNLIWRTVILVIIYVNTLKTDAVDLSDNIMMYLTPH